MRFTSQQYAQVLYEAVHESKDHDKVLDNFVNVLVQNGDLAKFEEIEAEYKKLELKSKGILSGKLTTAQEVEINSSLVNELNEIVGSKVEMKKQLDSNIVGGVVVKVDETLIDASVKTQLENLNARLKE